MIDGWGGIEMATGEDQMQGSSASIKCERKSKDDVVNWKCIIATNGHIHELSLRFRPFNIPTASTFGNTCLFFQLLDQM